MNKVSFLSRFITEGRVSFFWQSVFFLFGTFLTWVYVWRYENMDTVGLIMMIFVIPLVSMMPFFIYYICQQLPALNNVKPFMRYVASLFSLELIFLTIYAISLLLGMSKMSFKDYIIWRADEAAILLFNSSVICAAVCACGVEMLYDYSYNNSHISVDDILDDVFIDKKDDDNQ